MSMKAKLDEDLKAAMRSKDAVRLSTIRMLKTSINNAEIAKKKEFTDEEILPVIQTSIKQRRDSIEQYSKGNRPELAAKEKVELEILQTYLPAQLSEEEVRALVAKAIAETGASLAKDMGKVMGKLMPFVKGKAENSFVSSIVKEHLK